MLAFLLVSLLADTQSAAMLVRVQVGRGPVFVNQPVPLRVSVVTDGQRPEITPPPLKDARLLPVAMSVRPVRTDATGAIVRETSQYWADFLLVPARPGTLTVPPFGIRQAGRSAGTTPATVVVRPWPPDRPAAFLGGVGRIQVETRVQPSAIRLGDALEYEIRLIGPGAIGSDRPPPALDRLRSLPIIPTIAALLPDVSSADPPQRVLRFRIRPTRPGAATLPAVPVAWLDPKTGRYQTVIGAAVPIRVADVPAFNPAHLSYGTHRPETRSRSWPWIGVAVTALLAGLVPLARRVAARRRLRARSPERVARAWSRRLATTASAPEQAARLVSEGLAAYLKAARGRPEGALTPLEARHAIDRVTGRADLADLAARLISEADRARFANTAAAAGPALGQAASTLFAALAGVDPCAGSHQPFRHA